MERRQDKYDEEVQPAKQTRAERHQSLYNEINSKIGYEEISSLDSNGTEIDLSSLNTDRPSREEYQKIKDYKNIIDDEGDNTQEEVRPEPVKPKTFDINAALEEAKRNRKNEDELEKKRNLAESESVLSSLNKKYLHTKDFDEKDSDELKDLIDTITSKTMIDDIKDEEEKELLSDLLATTIDIKLEQELSNEDINKLYASSDDEDTDKDDDNDSSEDFETDKLDNSFFTHSVELKKDDLIDNKEDEEGIYDEDDDDEEIDKLGIAKIVIVVIIILILVLLITFFILKQMGFSI